MGVSPQGLEAHRESGWENDWGSGWETEVAWAELGAQSDLKGFLAER